MGTTSALHELEAFEAALALVAQYELSDAEEERSEELSGDDSDAPGALGAASARPPRSQLHRAHSLELPTDAADSTVDGPAVDAFEPLVEPTANSRSQFVKDQGGIISTSPEAERPSRSRRVVAGGRRLDAATTRLVKIARPAKAPRVSRRQELLDLRRTVTDLNRQLESLHAPSTSEAESTTAQASDYVCSLLSETESVWEQLAACQLAARRHAEQENQRLWTLVDEQVRHTKNLKRKLQRQARKTELAHIRTLKRFKPLTELESQRVLADLERSMDELYVGVDKRFADGEMPTLPCPGRKRQVKRDAVNGVFIELLDCHPVPFEPRTAEKAVWASLGERGLRYKYGRSFSVQTMSETDSTIMASHEFDVQTFGHYNHIQSHRVARRYVEESQSVVVCQTVIQPLDHQSGEPFGLQFLEVQLLTVARDARTPSTSVIRSLMSITRLELDGEPARRFRADAYVDKAISGWDESKDQENRLIENVLMEDLLASR